MNTLYIIGNGFDCYCHEMKTKYKDFRDYLIELYPDSEEVYGVPLQTLTPDHHGYDFADEDIVAYIVQVLDTCQGDDWSDLESALGADIYEVFEDEFDNIDMNDDDNDIFNSIGKNQENGHTIATIFDKVKELFFDWVNKCLGEISYDEVECKTNYRMILRENLDDSYYINFNYTYTLEKVYGIDADKVWHIHGQVGDCYEKILFGHGNNSLTFDEKSRWGAVDFFDELAEKLRKDTSKVIDENKNKFVALKDVKKIYSSGFSFSDVDMVYIQELCNYINPSTVAWYFNAYDTENNPKYLEKIQELGFKINMENRW